MTEISSEKLIKSRRKTGSLNRKVVSVMLLDCCIALAFLASVPISISFSQGSRTLISSDKLQTGGTVLSQTSFYPANAMWVEPSNVGVDFRIGRTFNVSVWVNIANSSFVWQIGLKFNTAYLNASRAGYTADYKSDFFNGHTTFGVMPVLDNNAGIVYYCESLVGSDVRSAGSGSLCWIEFQVVAPTSQTTLYLDPDKNNTFILDPDLNDISFTRYDAVVWNTQPGSHNANAMWIEPSDFNISFTTGTKFNVTVWANLSQSSYVWESRLRFDTAYLNALRADYTGQGKSDFFTGHSTVPIAPEINNAQGYVIHGESLVGVDVRSAGSGSLFWIEFQVVNPTNETALYLDAFNTATFFLDADLNFIPFTAYVAIVRNGPTLVPTMVFVNPAVSTVGLNRPFTINVSISNVTDLYNWEFKLYYQKAFLNFTGATEGSFLRSGGNTVWVDSSNPNYNATHGMVYVGASLMGLISGVNGNGTLASIGFQELTLDNSTLSLSDVVLLDSQLNEMPCVTADGSVVVGRENLVVSSVAADKNIVGQNYTMNVTVTVQNQGASAQSFNVTLFGNSTVLGVQQVIDLLPDGNYTFTLNCTFAGVWNVSGFVFGNYTLSAVADNVPGEINYDDNTLVNGTLSVVIPGNINTDTKVDMRDIGAICRLFGLRQGDALFSTTCDLNNDGKIDMRDIGIVCRNFGQHYP